MATATSSLMIVKEAALSSEQNTFNRLRQRLETLQKAQEKCIQELDECLLFYFNKIQPAEKIFQSALIERLKIAYQFYKTQRCFSGSYLDRLIPPFLNRIGALQKDPKRRNRLKKN